MAGRFEILKDSNESYWFRLTAGDGTVVAESPTFKHLDDVVHGINAVRENAATGLIVDRSTQDARAAVEPPGCKAA